MLLRQGALLDAEELLDVRKVAQIPTDIHRIFEKRDREEFPNLFSIVDALPMFPELVEAIGDCIDAEGNLLDRASPELRAIPSQVITPPRRYTSKNWKRRCVHQSIKKQFRNRSSPLETIVMLSQ